MTDEEVLKNLNNLKEWLRLQVVALNKTIKKLERLSEDENSTKESRRKFGDESDF